MSVNGISGIIEIVLTDGLAECHFDFMSDRPFNVLFLCTGNSARSILGESIVNRLGGGRFRGYSAGSHPRGEVHPLALDLLAGLGHDTSVLASKSWDVFAVAGAPRMDFIFTVCDSAAGEACPIWPGQPMTAHWGMPDPAAAEGTEIEKRAAFRATFAALENRLKVFMSLPLVSLDRLSLQQRLDAIGNGFSGSAAA
jgi:arsenate reductase